MVPLGVCTGCSICLAQLPALGSLECCSSLFKISNITSLLSLCPIPSSPSPQLWSHRLLDPPLSLQFLPCSQSLADPTPRDDPVSLSLTHSPPMPPTPASSGRAPAPLTIFESIPLLSFKTGINQLFHGKARLETQRGVCYEPCPKGSQGNRSTEKEYTTFPSPTPPPALPTKGPKTEQRCPCPDKVGPRVVAGWAFWAGGPLEESLAGRQEHRRCGWGQGDYRGV